MQPPKYFNDIQRGAAARWDQLESDPDLAGPWHQLFRQVQSPRHVVSELLQNADDVGARSASVRIQDNTFIFEHDGDDFDAEQFASLCRFGFSNKRTLHTIGFRGVGFKSTFALGDTVEVHTPTLAIGFRRKRFTQPIWLDDARPTERTVIQVRIADKNRALQLRKNFEEWAQSPTSLLFFNSLRELTIEGNVIRRQAAGRGPAKNTSWVKMIGADTARLLVVSSEPVRFPDEASEEIRSERGLIEEELLLPPCRVEIVLGLSETKRLYVVLPTGAELNLPFSCNAPFIQDPARFAIKDPATSPTNRWLLERTGRLAGQVLLEWLGNDELPVKARAQAYDLLKGAVEFSPGLEGTCSQIIMESMLAELKDQRLVLTTSGKLAKAGDCVTIPAELFSVWEPEQLLTKLFAPGSNHLLPPEVSTAARSALRSHGWLNEVDADDVLQRLEQNSDVPHPSSWPQLHALWCFVQREVKYDWSNERRRRMRIVPVDGSKTLHAANGVVRLSSRRDLLSPTDWKFVMDYAPTVDGDWVASISRRAPKKTTPAQKEENDPGYNLLQALGLHEPSSVDRIAAQASLRIFTGKEIALADCVRIAHIMAALGASIPAGFRYVTKDRHLRDPEHGVVMDETGRVEDIVPASWAQEHIVHEDYSRNFTSCTPETWRNWVETEGSHLLKFAPLTECNPWLHDRSALVQFVTDRGGHKPEEFHYKRDDFKVVDYGLPPELMEYWEKSAKDDPSIWAGVLEGILAGPAHLWKHTTQARIVHKGYTHNKRLECGHIQAEWIMHFHSVACIPDTHGKVHAPAELLLRTPDTESLMGVEPFVRADLDTERTKSLLKRLGVRDTPTRADNLLARLRALSGFPHPEQHLSQISRIYEALDRVVQRCRPDELLTIVESFQERALILTEAGEWLTSNEVSIFPEEGDTSPAVHPSFRNLGLWPRVDVPERPAVDRTIEWLKSLQSGTRLDASGLRRVRLAIQREPQRIWNETGHWLSLDSTWEPTSQLQYRLTMQGLMKWGELAPSIKQATANLTMITVETAQLPPFASIRNLGDAVEVRVTDLVETGESSTRNGWLEELAAGLCRVILSSEVETNRVRAIARRLQETTWCSVTKLVVMPYVDGVPAGEPFSPRVLWENTRILVGNFSSARLHKDLADELARPFEHSQIAAAIAACIDRDRAFVSEYLASQFELDASLELIPPSSGNAAKSEEQSVDAAPGEPESGGSEQEQSPSEGERDAGNSEAQGEEQTASNGKSTRPRTTTPRQPTLIERYARQRGFRWHAGEKCFTHPDGRWIAKSESPFNWEECANDGSVVRRLWVSDQKLNAGVEVAAELWSLLSQQPATTGLVILGTDQAPCALTGQEILHMKNSRQLSLYPSRYRLSDSGSSDPIGNTQT